MDATQSQIIEPCDQKGHCYNNIEGVCTVQWCTGRVKGSSRAI